MRISELSARSGRSIPTIKYYLREGLLPPGRRTATNQADYGDDHVRRLRLLATLLDVGGLSIASTRAVLEAIADDTLGFHEVLGVAHHALALRATSPAPSPDQAAAEAEIDRFLATRAWNVKADAPARRELAAVLVSLRRLGWRVDADVFDHYATSADELARWELSRTPSDATRDRAVESVVVGTVVFETALLALRRLAEEHHSAARFGGADQKPNAGSRPR
jgi:DNA-binding transcriptional MerR regulator